MTHARDKYLTQLRKALGDHPEADEITAEIESHIEEKVKDGMLSGEDEEKALYEMLSELGNPKKMARAFQAQQTPRQRTVRNAFILCNCLFFSGGILLTILSHVTTIPLFQFVWESLTEMSMAILVFYAVFWFYLGYGIGKRFGPRGSSLFRHTVFLTLIPNVGLMLLTLFNMIPDHWFGSMLTPAFLIFCVAATVLFYPLSKTAYKIGTFQGV